MRTALSFQAMAAWALAATAVWAACAASAQAADAPTITASVSESALPESAGTVQVRLTLEHPPEAAEDGEGYTGCRLRLGSGGAAESPADVTFSNQKKLNPSNGWSAEAKLMTVVDDALVEGNESLVVEGHCTGSKKGTQPSHEELASRPLKLTIVDDDEPGAVTLSVSPDRIDERGGEQAVTVSAETAEAPNAAVTVSLDLGSGAYTVTGTRSIEIAVGATGGSTTLTFAPSNDGNTSHDRVTIGGSAPGYVVAGTSLTIEEPPAGPPPRIVASVASTVLLESAGRVDVRLTLENPPDTVADDEGYTGCRLRLGAGGDAGTPEDVTFSNQKKLNADNGWSAEAGLLTVVDDALVEGDESLVVEGHCTGSRSGTQPSHEDLQSVPLTLTVRDNDFPDMTLSVSPDRIGEKDGAQAVTVTASTDHAPESAVTVRLDLGPGAYQVSGTETIEIAAHASSGSTTLTFSPLTDGNLSDDEVIVDGYASGYTVIGTVLTIVEPPPGPPPRIVASVAANAIGESAGRVDVRLTLEHPPEVIEDYVGYTGCRLRLGAGSEATEPADVTFSNQKKLNRGNGWTAEAGLLTVVDDTLVEGDETLVVEGYCTGDNGGPEPSHAELESVPLTLTVEDDDRPGIALSVNPERIGEDRGAQAVTVTASTRDAPQSALTVNLDPGAGAYGVTGTLAIEIEANATRGATTLTFEPYDDGNVTDDEVRIDGSASGYVVTGATLTVEEPAVRLTPRIVASVDWAVVRESEGDMRVRLRLEHPPDNAAAGEGYTGCRLRLGSGGDAETPGDATFPGSVDLTSSNGWSAQADLLTVVDDTVREDDETLIVEGYCTGSTGGIDPPHLDLESVPLRLTIEDNDDPVMRLSVSPRYIIEGSGERVVTVTAETDEGPEAAVTVNLILGAGAYSTTGLRFVEIEAGATSGSTALTFEAGHDGNRTDDRVLIDGSAPGYVVIATSLTIDEPAAEPLPVIVASVSGSSLSEAAGGVNVRLTLDHPPETDGEGGYTGCRLRLGAGGEAEEPADVLFQNQKKLNPSNGWSAEARLLRVVEDETYEGDETLVIEGYCTGTNRGVEPSHADLDFVPLTLTIEENDLPTISLTTNPKRIGEGGGEQAVTVMAWAEKAPERDGVMVHLEFESGSYAVTGSRSIWIDRDERSASRTLTFEPADDGNTTDDGIGISGRARGYRVDATVLTVQDSENGAPTPTALVPLFLNASNPFRQGFVRIVNRSATAGEVRLTAVDDTGWRPAPLTISLAASSAVHLNSDDLENGNANKGLADGVGRGTGQWRLLFDSDLDIRVLTYVRTRDGFLTAVHDVAPTENGKHRIATFNPGSNVDQVSTLRVINLSDETAQVAVEGYDQSSIDGSVVRFDVPANAVRAYTAAELESGAGLEGSLGSGTGKWQLEVASGQPILAMSLLESPEGYLTNLSSIPGQPEGAEGVHPVPLFPAASDPLGRQGFVRLVSRSPFKGDVTVSAYDRSGTEYSPLTVALDAREAAHFNSDDLELGGGSNGLAGSTGSGNGDWRLELTSVLDLDVLSYVRTPGGFLTSMHDLVPSVQGVYDVATFNPASNRQKVSRLLLINPGSRAAAVSVEGIDDAGASPGGAVVFNLAAGTVRVLDAAQLESGDDGISGALGDGRGKWRLTVAADRPILVVNLLTTSTGHITNLSSVPD